MDFLNKMSTMSLADWIAIGFVFVWFFGLYVSRGAPPKKMAKIGN